MKKIIISILLMFILFSPIMASAGAINPSGGGGEPPKLENPLGENTTPQILIGRIINAILGVIGSLTLIMFIYGGLIWMTAAGNMEKVNKGRAVLLWATIGLVVIFSSYGLVKFIIQKGLGG